MDHEHLVRQAAAGDVAAFVELTRRFQHFAFGSALALVHDLQQAEDVIQEAFVAAWLALPSLGDPKAFPGWLRGIVRHHAFRVLRRNEVQVLPLAEAERVPSDEQPADHRVEQRQRAAAALTAMAELPDSLREPALLFFFFVHECSHQDIATFLGVSVATVNNRLHAARVRLKRRMPTMVTEALHSHGLSDDFANRIGRLIEACGNLVDVLFDPNAMPDILSELAVSDEANTARRQCPGRAASRRRRRARRRDLTDRRPAARQHGFELWSSKRGPGGSRRVWADRPVACRRFAGCGRRGQGPGDRYQGDRRHIAEIKANPDGVLAFGPVRVQRPADSA